MKRPKNKKILNEEQKKCLFENKSEGQLLL